MGPNIPAKITDNEVRWLEEAREPEPESRSECCTRCRRGTRAHGTLPCGFLLQCPRGCHG